MNEHEKRVEASLLQPREGAGKYWWETFLRGHISDINRRFNQARALYITVPSEAPLDLFSYIREAALCFEIGRYLPAIVLASQSVELILQRDMLMKPSRAVEDANHKGLSSRSLIAAATRGLPVDTLLSPEEVLSDIKPILFVERYDCVLRGDVSSWFRAISEYLPSVEHDALDQLEKAQRFVVTWFNRSMSAQEG